MRSLVLIALLSTVPVVATAKSDAIEVSNVLSKDDQVRLREQLKAVAQGFDIKAEPSEEQKEKKTMADVADKALDMTASFVTNVAGMLEKSAPMVLEIMVRQQIAKAVQMLVGPWATFLGFLLAALIVRRYWVLDDHDHRDDIFEGEFLSPRGWRALTTFFVPTIVCTIMGCIGTYNLGEAVALLINPKYYAIRDLLKMLLAPGTL